MVPLSVYVYMCEKSKYCQFSSYIYACVMGGSALDAEASSPSTRKFGEASHGSGPGMESVLPLRVLQILYYRPVVRTGTSGRSTDGTDVRGVTMCDEIAV